MCGGGNNSALQAQQQAEADRQARISTNVAAINSAFDKREPQYADFVNALRTKYQTDLQHQQSQQGRQLKFSLAKSGNTGGSVATDAQTEFNREAAQAAVGAESQAQGAGAKLKAQDESSRANMISLAQAGGDIGNAATQTANMLQANISSARAEGQAQGLGDVFGNTAAAYKKMNDAKQFQAGYASTRQNLWGKV